MRNAREQPPDAEGASGGCRAPGNDPGFAEGTSLTLFSAPFPLSARTQFFSVARVRILDGLLADLSESLLFVEPQ